MTRSTVSKPVHPLITSFDACEGPDLPTSSRQGVISETSPLDPPEKYRQDSKGAFTIDRAS